MEKRMLLTDSDRAAALKDLPGWSYDAHARALRRHFVFADFAQAFDFMTRVAAAAEAMDHHPDWTNAWNKIDVALSTHSAGGVTALDLALARAIDGAAGLPS
jgi:4a-hydroxytetrahydrobiopterin dehydratase